MFGLSQFWAAFIIKQVILLVILLIGFLFLRRRLKGFTKNGSFPVPPFLKNTINNNDTPHQETAREILERDYALGKITEAEFTERRNKLDNKNN